MRRSPLRSPPRMRGKGLCKGFHLCDVGITPAYAGKSGWHSCCPGCNRDHPRVCGEKMARRTKPRKERGSPPRMRGKVSGNGRRFHRHGITPAYAGKSGLNVGCLLLGRDHPRVCGEKISFFFTGCSPRGSPPRMRGKARAPASRAAPCGITPACAGKSARRQAGPPGPAPPPQMRLGWSPPPCTGRQCRTRKSTHARRARIPAPAHTPAPQ